MLVKKGWLITIKEIACFSYDDKHEFHLDERSLRYYYPPLIGTDLCKGFETFEQLDDTADDHLDGLLRTILELEQRTGSRCTADFITWRGMMTKVNWDLITSDEHGLIMTPRSWQRLSTI